MIAIQNLITLAPFSQEVKTELLKKVDSFSDDKKRQLIDMSWDLISQWYHDEVRHRYNEALLEMAEGKKTHTKEYLEKIPDHVFTEFTTKLEGLETIEDITEIRKKLTNLTTAEENK